MVNATANEINVMHTKCMGTSDSITAFTIAGILYGFGSWLESIRQMGSGSASYGQGWETEAIAACVVGGISFSGGIGKIQGIVVGVMILYRPDIFPDHPRRGHQPAVCPLRHHHFVHRHHRLSEVRPEEVISLPDGCDTGVFTRQR